MRMYSEEDWHRLVRYLTGECSPAQQKKTEAWILEDERRAQLMDSLNQIWEVSDVRLQASDVDTAWEEVRSELDLDSDGADTHGRAEDAVHESRPGPSVTTRKNRSSPLARRSRSSVVTRLSRVGGVLLGAALLVTLLVSEVSFEFVDSSSAKLFSTEAGQRATVRLNDGSKVHLNVESQLKVESDFGEKNRTVSLEGEAFFEVADDRSNPFIVRMDGIRTEVVGTAFNIEAYSEASDREVAVTEGSVTVHPDQSDRSDPLQLRANNLGVVSDGHIHVVRDRAEIQKEIAWKDGQLVFDDAPFDQVVQDLQRWYDATVRTEVDASEVDRLNATFKEESLGEAARAISVALDLQYRENSGTLTFYRSAESDTP